MWSTAIQHDSPRQASRNRPRRIHRRAAGASLIELLVVLTIIGIMMSLLLPALSAARARVQINECDNNRRQLQMALTSSIQVRRRFPLKNRWTVDLLPWIEQQALAQALEKNLHPDGPFPRPAIMQCPRQIDFASDVPGAGICHFVLVVERPVPSLSEGISWSIEDRPKFTGDEDEEPWYVGPELNNVEFGQLLSLKGAAHPPSLF